MDTIEKVIDIEIPEYQIYLRGVVKKRDAAPGGYVVQGYVPAGTPADPKHREFFSGSGMCEAFAISAARDYIRKIYLQWLADREAYINNLETGVILAQQAVRLGEHKPTQ